MKLEEFELTQDPFPIVPDGPVHNWAGRNDLKLDLLDIVRGVRARDVGITEFVVLHGEYGAGKSHALRFLRTFISEQTAEFRSLALYVERPRVANKLTFTELQRYILKIIGRDKLLNYCKQVSDIITRSAQETATTAGIAVNNMASFLEQVINNQPVDDRAMIRLLLRGVSDVDNVFAFLVGNERCKDDEYEGKVDSDFMAAKVLSDLFRVLTSSLRGNERVLESVYLFIDECEILAEAKATESELIFTGLRELINGLPYRFGLMLSFSAATALIEAIMPQHLLKRLTRLYIEIPMLSDGEAVEFLRAQINFFRPNGSGKAGTFYPFEQEAVEYIVQNQNSLTPRSLFIDCKRVLERSLRREDLQPGEVITRDMADRILQGYR